MVESSKAWLLVRLGVAFAFLYPAVAAYLSPENWVGYFPAFVFDLVPNEQLALLLFGAIEVVVALWIFSGKKLLIPASLASLMLASIVVFNWNQIEILFRDLALLGATLGIAVQAWQERA